VPVIITAVGVYFFFAPLGLANSLAGLVLAHAVIAVPLVLVTVNASVSQLDRGLLRAAESLGAPPMTTFRKITIPLILPGIVSGTIFAFAASFDEVVIALMITGPGQKTLPRELLSGTRENLDPTVLAVASILIAISAGLLLLLTLVQHRSAKYRA
jgi:putative spermidine/putrescine transport system permease protein